MKKKKRTITKSICLSLRNDFGENKVHNLNRRVPFDPQIVTETTIA